MEIAINDARRISEIQEEFNKGFPFLKLEFFTGGHHKNQLSPNKNMIPNDRLLGSFRMKHNSGTITMDAFKTVVEIEEEIKHNLGLNAQILRKSGSLWIETSLTDKWSLALQNSEGYEISKKHGKSFSLLDPDNNSVE